MKPETVFGAGCVPREMLAINLVVLTQGVAIGTSRPLTHGPTTISAQIIVYNCGLQGGRFGSSRPPKAPTWSKAADLACTWGLNQLADRLAQRVAASAVRMLIVRGPLPVALMNGPGPRVEHY
jgi:hypothetical protein